MLNFYKFLYRLSLSNLSKLKHPYKLTFAVTYRCNLKCKTCFIWTKESNPELSIKQIERFFKIQNFFSWVDLTGGEIFLRSDIIEIISVILKYNRDLCILHFPTNGQLTDKIISTVRHIYAMKKNIVIPITISMDGPRKIDNEIKGSDEAWDNALRTFMKLRHEGYKHVYFGYTISQYNISTFKRMLREIESTYPNINLYDFHINIISRSKHYYGNDSLPINYDELLTDKILYNLQSRRISIKSILERKYIRLAIEFMKNNKIELPCLALSATLFLDPYGNIYPCLCYNKKIANIIDIDYGIDDIWNTKPVEAIRTVILKRNCVGCWTPCEAYPAILGSLLKFYDLQR